MCRGLHHDAILGHLVQSSYRVWQLGSLDALQSKVGLFLPLADLLVVKEVLWQEADHFVTIFDPELDSDLDPTAGEQFI